MANGQQGAFNPKQIFQILQGFVGSPLFGVLFDIFVVGPENKKRFDEFVATQNATTDFKNEIRKALGIPQEAIPGSAFAALQDSQASKQGEIERLEAALAIDPTAASSPDNIRNLQTLKDELAGIQSELAGPEDTTLSQVQDVGEETSQLARDFLSPGATDERFGDIFDPISTRLLADNALFQRRTSEAQAGHDAILSRAQGLVGQLGGQERADINERADATGSAQQAALAARGLGGTTVTTSQNALNERERTGELGRLNERLVREQLGVESTFGLAGLGFQERSGQFGANLNLATTGALAGIGEARFNVGTESINSFIQQLIQSGVLGPNYQFDLSNSALAQGANVNPPGVQPSVSQQNF